LKVDVILKIFCIIIPLYFALGCLAVAAFLGALGALGAFATFGATGAAGAVLLAFSHCSGKFVRIIDPTLDQEPKGLLARINLIGASPAALYSAGDRN